MRRAFTVSLWVLLALIPRGVMADGPPTRETLIQVEKTASIWVVGAWEFETCRILTESVDVIPQYADISALCGSQTTTLMNAGTINLYYLGEYKYLEDAIFPLPEIEIVSSYAGNKIIVQATDPLPEQSVVKVDALINGSPAVCDSVTGQIIPGGVVCEFPVYNLDTVLFSAFATSTYGDLSKTISLRIGNMKQADTIFSDPQNKVSVIGDNAYAQYNLYHDIPRVWGVVPGYDNVPDWTKTVQVEGLVTDHPYYYLAGQILLHDFSAGLNCPNRGISGEYGTNCGVLSVFDEIYQYQNAYNEEITTASARSGVPNRIIKRIMSIESQFYPNARGIAGENGLYQFTRDGADTLFRWNGPFYIELCGEYWNYCDAIGYDSLDQWQRDVLINHVMTDPNNLYYLGSALKANAYQITRILDNIAGVNNPGEIFTYEDLWKITVLNYHAGATVTSAVLVNTQMLDLPITWESFATVLRNLQPSALHYVNRVYKGY